MKANITKSEMSELFDIYGHDIRTYGIKINWIFEMLLDYKNENLSKKEIEIIKIGYQESQKLLQTLKNINIINRSGKWNFKKEKINLVNILEQAIKEYKDIAGLKEIKLNIKIEKNKDFSMIMNSQKLKFSICGLIDNAIKYSNKKSEININLKKNKDDIIIEIKDTGIGIPKKDKEKIFKKFFKSKNSINKKYGIGMGLFIIKRIIEDEGGTISVESKEGKFTIFTINIPII